jgi:hypothetical protein
MIEVRLVGDGKYQVKVAGTKPTTHTVTLRESDRKRLSGANISAEKLIEESFRFLLEREPNTSILPAFDLPLIGQYFPEYARVIGERL